MLYGIIDIGSSTIRMAVYNIAAGRLEFLYKRKHIVGLAGFVKDGRMTEEGIRRAAKVLSEYVDFLRAFEIAEVHAFTTAALRNCTNSREAVAELERRTGLHIRVISGDEEATFDFIGATHGLAAHRGLLVDIGGGSTELVSFDAGKILEKISLPMGAEAFRAAFVHGILPSRAECEAMRAWADEILAGARAFAGLRAPDIAGIGGTMKSGAALYNAVRQNPPGNLTIEAKSLRALVGRFTRDKKRTQEDTVLLMRAVPDRLPTIFPGLVIAAAVAEKFACERITYCDAGVREGFIYSEILGKSRGKR